MRPGPGGALLMRSSRCRCNPWAPVYPASKTVDGPRLFCSEVLHCCTYCDGAWGSNVAKLTTVLPNTGEGKLKPASAGLGVKLSLCWVMENTSGGLCSWLHQVFRSTGV